MEKKSPFGDVFGLEIYGTTQEPTRSVVVRVNLLLDSGLNSVNVPLSKYSTERGVSWDGVGNLEHCVRLATGEDIEVHLAYAHSADTRTLDVSSTIHFKPHGWIRFKDTVLSLDRSMIRLSIPMDIEEEHMSDDILRRGAGAFNQEEIERLYGMKIRDPEASRKKNALYFSRSPKKRARPRDDSEGLPDFYFDENKRQATLSAVARNDAIENELMMISDALPSMHHFNTIEEQTRISMEGEKRRLEELKEKWELELYSFVSGLFRTNMNRTREIVRSWHRRVPVKNDSAVFNPVLTFLEVILFREVALRVTETHLYIFSDETGLGIPTSWLTKTEQLTFNRFYIARRELFTEVSVVPTSRQYELKGFRLNHLIENAMCRRFIAHQFVLDCIETALECKRPVLFFSVISAVACLHVHNKRDEFLLRMKIAFEKASFLEALREVGMFVKIGNSEPDYASQTMVIPIVNGIKHYFAPPKTPFRLVH